MNATKKQLFVLAMCMTNFFCFGQQQSGTGVCKLGEIKNDSLLPYIHSLQIDCKTDIKTYKKKSSRLTTLSSICLSGDASSNDWTTLFNTIKLQPGVKEIVFENDTFPALPSGYEGLNTAERMVFKNNEGLDYQELVNQLATLPNLQELTLDIVTIFDLPDNLVALKNIRKITLINTDEAISKNEEIPFDDFKEPVTYDYYLDKGNGNYAALKYTSVAGEIDSDEYKELSKRFKTTFNMDGTETAFIPKYQHVQPPIKGIDVERTQYIINPGIENVITYPTGTKIKIPANAFADKNGNPVTESVTLNYRELRDPVDFLVSGIPMKYDTAGEVTNFESAGMFELTANVKSEPLQLAKDKKIDMNFASTSKDSTYNFYAFNDSSGNWNYLNKPKTVTAAAQIQVMPPTPAYRIYTNSLYSRVNEYDSTSFAGRFNSNLHLYTSVKDTVADAKREFEYTKDGKDRHKRMMALIKINGVRRTKAGDVLFKINSLADAHPELQEFNGVYFASNENISAAEFKEKYQRKKEYNDVRIYAKGGDLEIKLKNRTSFKSISASLVTIDGKGVVKKSKDTDTRMRRYNRKLNNREKTFDRKLAKGKLEGNEITTSDSATICRRAFANAKSSMNDAEKKMNLNEWVNYCNQTTENYAIALKAQNAARQAVVSAGAANSDNLMESLQLDGLGIYNCDQIQRMKQPVEIFAGYKTGDDQKLSASKAYVIDKHSNSVFQYDGYKGFNANKIAFDQNSAARNTLLAIDQNGEIAVYKTEFFKSQYFKNKSHFDFVVTKINSNFTSVSDLKKLIGF